MHWSRKKAIRRFVTLLTLLYGLGTFGELNWNPLEWVLPLRVLTATLFAVCVLNFYTEWEEYD